MYRLTLAMFIFGFSGLFISTLDCKAQSPVPFYTETFPSTAEFSTRWTSLGVNTGPEKWKWNNTVKGLFEGQPDFASRTAANGFAVFNSEDNGDVAHDVFLSALVPINCASRKNVFLRFENQYAYYSAPGQSLAQVGVSFDSINYTYITILEDVQTNSVTSPRQIVTLELPGAAGKAKVFLRFRWKGKYEYAWRIDDISLFEGNPQPSFDLALSNPILPESFALPLSQVQEIPFVATLSNKGTKAQNKVRLSVRVISSNGQTFSADSTIQTVRLGANDTFLIRRNFVPRDTGSYATQYQVQTDSADEVASDNSLVSGFVVTRNLFAKDDGILVSATQPSQINTETWEAGNYYYIPKAGFDAYEASFSVASNANAHQGKSVSLLVYQYIDNGDNRFDDKDLKVVGYGFHEFKAEKNFELINTPLLNIETNNPGVPLKEKGDYLLMVQYTKEMFVPYSRLTYHYGQLSTVIRNGDWFGGGFGKDITALVRMRIRDKSTAVPLIRQEVAGLSVFPNPATQVFQVSAPGLNTGDVLGWTLYDASGKVVHGLKVQSDGRETWQMEAPLANGSYLIHCLTRKGVVAGKVLIVD